MRVMTRSTFLASFSSSFFPFLLLFLLLLLFPFLHSHSIICQKWRTLDVKVSFSISRIVLAVVWMLKNGWGDEEVKRIWANGQQKGMRESSTELCAQTRRLYYIERSISTSHQACIRNLFNFIQRTFFFDHDDRFHKVFLSRSVVFEDNCWAYRKFIDNLEIKKMTSDRLRIQNFLIIYWFVIICAWKLCLG